jgi:hypothetical protein
MSLMIRRIFFCLFISVVGLVGSVRAQTILTATTRDNLSVYTAPELQATVLNVVVSGQVVTVLGRSDLAHWMLITDGTIQGWVVSGSMVLDEGVNLWDVPVAESETPIRTTLPVNLPSTNPDVLAQYQRLQTAPLLDNMETAEARAIFEHGQELGMRADVFTRVGDSNSTSGGFLNPIGMQGDFCEFGAYNYLQETVDFFSVPPQAGEANSFDSFSVAAVNGLSTAAALDPFWADPDVCQANESPLGCEYRLVQPSVAIIMLGLMDADTPDFDVNVSRDNMRAIMDFSIEQGVIPVWTTFPVLADTADDHPSWENGVYFNAAVLDVAEEYQTPVINLWQAVQPLRDNGIGPDRIHLAERVGAFCSFTGDEQRIGGTLRNLLTLQALDMLRRNVLTN